MKNQEIERAFEPIKGQISDSAIWTRMEARAGNTDLWAAQWANYPALLTVRDIMSRIIASHCSTCPNHYFLPDDDLERFLYYAEMADSIDMAEFFADVEAMFGIKIPEELSRDIDAYDVLTHYEASGLPYYSLLNKLLEFIEPGKGPDDLAAKALEPITNKTPAKYIRPRLELRAERPDLWAAQWPDEARLLEARDRVSRMIVLCSNKNYWPNVFFLPDDSMERLIWGEADSLDLVEIIMELEEIFDIRIDDKMSGDFFHSKSSYLDFLNKLLKMSDPAKDLRGLDYNWAPLKLPNNYYRRSWWGSLSRRFPILCGHYRDDMWQDQLRTAQAFRPTTWREQWPPDDHLIQLRDRVSRILVEQLQWLDGAFIPQDRLEAVFHSRKGLRHIIRVLKIINQEFKCDIPLEFIISGDHTLEDFLREIK